MSVPANSFLSHLKVPTKLSLGFGLVVLLAVLISGIAWWSLERLSVRANQFANISNIDRLVQEASFSALLYRQKPTDEIQAHTEQQIAQLRAEQQSLHDSLRVTEDVRLTEQLLALTDEFENAFSRLVAA